MGTFVGSSRINSWLDKTIWDFRSDIMWILDVLLHLHSSVCVALEKNILSQLSSSILPFFPALTLTLKRWSSDVIVL